MENQKEIQEELRKETEIYHIYDKIFKRIFHLSDLAIVNLINSLFHTNHSPDSKITYLNREFVARNLDRRFADMFIQIDESVYHLEAQMTKAKNIVVRVFEYGLFHAMANQEEPDILHFPKPIVIYLDVEIEVPKISTLTIDFGNQGAFVYKVENFVYQDYEIRELNQKKMIVLIPFQLLKLRKLMQKESSAETFELLQNLVRNDILGSIVVNLEVGNITEDDAEELKELTAQLFAHICRHYEELGGYKDMKELLEGAMELPLDKYRFEIAELKEKLEMQEKTVEKAVEEAEKAEAEKAELEEEIKRLRAALEEATAK